MDAVPVPQSFFDFYYQAIGLKYLLMFAIFAPVGIATTVMATIFGRGVALGATLLFAVGIPIFIGMLGTFDGLIASYQVIAASTVYPKPGEIAQGMSMSLATLWVGMFLALPSYFLAAIGMAVRALKGEKTPGK
jgi:hypothetical protein